MVINMFSHTFNIHFLIVALCVFMCAGNSNINSCVETDKQALLKLKADFIDDFKILSSWKHEADCCEWNGISCNRLTGHVTKLQVSNLKGKIDSSLCDLQHLTQLNLAFSEFEGSKIPKCIGSLNQLRELNLSSASLSGTIPHELRNLSNLQTLDIGYNDQLIGNDLKWLSNLSSLRYLDLSRVNLSQAFDWQSSLSRKTPQLRKLILKQVDLVGIIPRQLGNLSNIETLDLSENFNLIANDLKWISQLSSLRYLDLSEVNLSQAFDWQSSLSNLSSLLELSLDGCALPQINPKSTILQYVASDAFTNTTSLESLYLRRNNLDSGIGKAISNLCRLRKLDLASNNLSGQLSDWISHLYCAQHSIELLDLSHNPFRSGPFPDFSNFSYLDLPVLKNTSLNGPIPPSLGHLLHLSQLDISYNNLFGPIPQSLGYLPHLSTLDISHNNLSGPFPKLHQLPSLELLFMSDNKLNGVVTEGHLSTLSNLKYLDVSNNFLSFNFSPKWVPPFQLLAFFARSCNFSIGFPMWLKHQGELMELDISSGSISDSIPEWICLLPSLSYLNISNNKIHGELPRSLLPISGMFLDLSFNYLSGPIPQFSSQVLVLLLSNNRFSGTISSLCATLLSQLRHFDMSSNLLTGKLPHCWRQFISLEVLILANNNFSGEIPSSIGTLKEIKTIHLNNNNFSGKIPSLMNSPYLQFIDFGQNNLYGKLPAWIGHCLPKLIVLRLQANKFHGSIPTSLCKLSLLQILDLSQNNITETIPHCFNNLSALPNLTFPRHTISYSINASVSKDLLFIENAMLNWKGEDVKYDKNLGLMTAIDLSGNHLTGEIPSSMTSLVALASLNLSRNNLTGFIPKNMGLMKRRNSTNYSTSNI